MTVEMCQKLCFEDRDYFFAGVQYYEHCFCGNETPLEKAPESECNLRCKGDETQFCRGGCRNNVYSKKGK